MMTEIISQKAQEKIQQNAQLFFPKHEVVSPNITQKEFGPEHDYSQNRQTDRKNYMLSPAQQMIIDQIVGKDDNKKTESQFDLSQLLNTSPILQLVISPEDLVSTKSSESKRILFRAWNNAKEVKKSDGSKAFRISDEVSDDDIDRLKISGFVTGKDRIIELTKSGKDTLAKIILELDKSIDKLAKKMSSPQIIKTAQVENRYPFDAVVKIFWENRQPTLERATVFNQAENGMLIIQRHYVDEDGNDIADGNGPAYNIAEAGKYGGLFAVRGKVVQPIAGADDITLEEPEEELTPEIEPEVAEQTIGVAAYKNSKLVCAAISSENKLNSCAQAINDDRYEEWEKHNEMKVAELADYKEELDRELGNRKLKLIMVADNDQSRQKGLMHHPGLNNNEAMLFVFDREGNHPFWNKNVKFPIDVAYFDTKGKLLTVSCLEAEQEESIRPNSFNAKYVLEANKGWFDKRGIREGDNLWDIIDR